jgi:outer membrane biosynthesis protein TonB
LHKTPASEFAVTWIPSPLDKVLMALIMPVVKKLRSIGSKVFKKWEVDELRMGAFDAAILLEPDALDKIAAVLAIAEKEGIYSPELNVLQGIGKSIKKTKHAKVAPKKPAAKKAAPKKAAAKKAAPKKAAAKKAAPKKAAAKKAAPKKAAAKKAAPKKAAPKKAAPKKAAPKKAAPKKAAKK